MLHQAYSRTSRDGYCHPCSVRGLLAGVRAFRWAATTTAIVYTAFILMFEILDLPVVSGTAQARPGLQRGDRISCACEVSLSLIIVPARWHWTFFGSGRSAWKFWQVAHRLRNRLRHRAPVCGRVALSPTSSCPRPAPTASFGTIYFDYNSRTPWVTTGHEAGSIQPPKVASRFRIGFWPGPRSMP